MERKTAPMLPGENNSLPSDESTDLSAEIDRSLMLQAKNGNPEAFAQIYDRHRRRVFTHLYYMTNNRHDTEELTADTFEKAFSAIPRFVNTGAPVKSWLLKIAHNHGLDYIRRRNANPSCLPIDTINENFMSTPGNPTANDAINKIMAERANDLIASLPEDEATALRMKLCEGEKYPKIAKALGKSIGASRVIVHRGLKKVREDLRLEFSADNSGEEVA